MSEDYSLSIKKKSNIYKLNQPQNFNFFNKIFDKKDIFINKEILIKNQKKDNDYILDIDKLQINYNIDDNINLYDTIIIFDNLQKIKINEFEEEYFLISYFKLNFNPIITSFLDPKYNLFINDNVSNIEQIKNISRYERIYLNLNCNEIKMLLDYNSLSNEIKKYILTLTIYNNFRCVEKNKNLILNLYGHKKVINKNIDIVNFKGNTKILEIDFPNDDLDYKVVNIDCETETLILKNLILVDFPKNVQNFNGNNCFFLHPKKINFSSNLINLNINVSNFISEITNFPATLQKIKIKNNKISYLQSLINNNSNYKNAFPGLNKENLSALISLNSNDIISNIPFVGGKINSQQFKKLNLNEVLENSKKVMNNNKDFSLILNHKAWCQKIKIKNSDVDYIICNSAYVFLSGFKIKSDKYILDGIEQLKIHEAKFNNLLIFNNIKFINSIDLSDCIIPPIFSLKTKCNKINLNNTDIKKIDIFANEIYCDNCKNFKELIFDKPIKTIYSRNNRFNEISLENINNIFLNGSLICVASPREGSFIETLDNTQNYIPLIIPNDILNRNIDISNTNFTFIDGKCNELIARQLISSISFSEKSEFNNLILDESSISGIKNNNIILLPKCKKLSICLSFSNLELLDLNDNLKNGLEELRIYDCKIKKIKLDNTIILNDYKPIITFNDYEENV